ncbi:hypothetical protein QFC21_001388 [Naganishia friedmannii]|uniref:Uncharacterized protein n=1 Tax=Naganishia friedmannii TaxID=89922 RepID=A0ACC2W467_9TREE|nr:hypothetical protein QFC21_001388 [Naganishia friedmannii]
MAYNQPRASTASHVPPSLAHIEGIDQLTPTQVRLLEKQQEYHGLVELKKASLNMLAKMEDLARMTSVMADGGEAIGSVLRNWPHVFSILNLFPAVQAPKPNNAQDDDEHDTKAETIPPLVRIPFTQMTDAQSERQE